MKLVRYAAFAAALASVALALAFSNRFGEDPTLVPTPLLGRPAPQVDLPLLGGSEALDWSSLEGQVIVVNFFASWCIPCREEQVDLSATADAFADRGVTVVEIAYQDSVSAAIAFLEETGTSPEAIYLADPDGRAAIAYGVFGIPETFFISADGIVVAKLVGATDALTLGSTLDDVLAGEQPGQQVLGDTFDGPSE